MDKDIAQMLIGVRMAANQTKAQYAAIKTEQRMQQQLIEMLQTSAEPDRSRPPAPHGQGVNVDISV